MMLAQISVAHCANIPIAHLIRYGARVKRPSYHSLLPRSIKKVIASPTQLKASMDQVDYSAAWGADSSPDLSPDQQEAAHMNAETFAFLQRYADRDKLATATTGKAGCRDPGIDAGLRQAPHLQRHAGGGILSKTKNLVFHTRITPGKAMSLPVRVEPCLPVAVDPRPAPDEAAPSAPGPLYVDPKHRRRVARAARQQAALLVPEIKHGVDRGDDNGTLREILTCPETLQDYARSLFFCRDQDNVLAQLTAAVQQALQSHHTTLPQSSHLILLQHLAHVCVGDAERALAALHALQPDDVLTLRMDVSLFVSGPYQSRRIQTRARLDALAIAGTLSVTDVTFGLLLKLAAPAFSEPQLHGVQRLLQAVAQIELEQGNRVDLAHHVLRAALDVDSGQASLAQMVLHVESRALQQMDEQAYADLSMEQMAALFAWNNGFREQGKGSELELVQKYLCKLLKYIRRAAHMQALLDVHFDKKHPWKSVCLLVDARARIVGIRLNQSIGRKKSPLLATAELGSNNAWLMQPASELQVLYDNTRNAIALLHERLQKELGTLSAAELRQQLQDPFMSLPTLVEHTALLVHWTSLLGAETPLGHRLDLAAVRKIADGITQDYACPDYLPVLEQKLAHWIGREFKISDLQQWADIHHAFSSKPSVSQDVTQECEEALSDALRRATASSTASSFPENRSQQAMHQFMHRFFREHNVGNTISSSNGSTLGLNTTPCMLSIRKLNECLSFILPVTATPSIDIRLTRAHNAVLTAGSTTHGFEVFIGSQRKKSASFGGALNINTSPFLKHIGISAGVGVAAAATCDRVTTRGVMVRSARDANADGSALDTAKARTEMVDFIDMMFAMAGEKDKAKQPEVVWQTLAARFFNSKTFSVGWQQQRESTPHLTGKWGVHERLGLGVDHSGIASAGLSSSRTVDWSPSISLARAEKTGAMRQLRSSNATRHQQIVSIAAVGATTSVPIHSNDIHTESLSFPQISETLNLLTVDKGVGAIFRTLVEQGQLSSLFSLRELELRDAQHFCRLLQQPECYRQCLHIFNARYGRANGERKLQEFMLQSENWAGPGQRYLMRSRLRDEVRITLNELIALAESNHRYGADSAMQQEIARAVTQLLQVESSWVMTEMMTLEAQVTHDGKGINLGGQMATQDAVASNRELSYVAVPLPVANQWMQERNQHVLPNIALQSEH